MNTPADYKIADDGSERAIVLTGDWSAITLGKAPARLQRLLRSDFSDIDLNEVGRFDTAGALALIDASDDKLDKRTVRGRPESLRILERVADAAREEPKPVRTHLSFNAMMARLGHGIIDATAETVSSMGFIGRLLVTSGRALVKPWTVRWPAVANLMERVGIDAIPIIVSANFFIGAVIAFLASSMLAEFGVQIFAVETVGFGVLREFAIVITAVLVAGRSASSYAAEIGSMKMQQEIDAMRTMGVDPFEAIVLPRFIALFIMIFFLTFMAALAGLFGGALVLWQTLDLSPIFFIQRIQDAVGFEQFRLALIKAPVMAMVVAAVGCRQGLLVGGDVESLGRRVTSAVVQSVFSIIVIDAIFALIFLELDI